MLLKNDETNFRQGDHMFSFHYYSKTMNTICQKCESQTHHNDLTSKHILSRCVDKRVIIHKNAIESN